MEGTIVIEKVIFNIIVEDRTNFSTKR